MDKPSELIRRAAVTVQEQFGCGARATEEKLGLKRWALRGILDSHRPQSPSVDRAAELCAALGLELYIGPPRQPMKSTFRAAKVDFGAVDGYARAVPDGELAALLAAIRDHWESLNDYGRRDFAANILAASAELRARRREHKEKEGATRRKGGSE